MLSPLERGDASAEEVSVEVIQHRKEERCRQVECQAKKVPKILPRLGNQPTVAVSLPLHRCE